MEPIGLIFFLPKLFHAETHLLKSREEQYFFVISIVY
jgi:hypothetical protein